ncbi:MAG: type II secretion system protein, partial [Aureliella sp.]
MFARSSKIRIGHSRPSFTLVELLVSIAIIGIMAGMVLYTLAGAQQDALRTRTRGTIDKINAVM